MLVFTFSDPSEMSKQFLNKLFSSRIMVDFKNRGLVLVLNINPPIDKEIEKVLNGISIKERITLGKYQIDDIKIKANRDLRSAI